MNGIVKRARGALLPNIDARELARISDICACRPPDRAFLHRHGEKLLQSNGDTPADMKALLDKLD